jgi:hypothetical protein
MNDNQNLNRQVTFKEISGHDDWDRVCLSGMLLSARQLMFDDRLRTSDIL